MNNRFTQKAQNTLNNSLRFAAEMGHTYIGSEHLLLALAAEKESVAAKLLSARGVSVDGLKAEIEKISGLGSGSSVSPADMTPRTKRIIEGSAMESVRAGQSYIGTEHLLLSLLGERDAVAVQILESMGISLPEFSAYDELPALIEQAMDGALTGLAEVILRSSADDLLLMGEIFVQFWRRESILGCFWSSTRASMMMEKLLCSAVCL